MTRRRQSTARKLRPISVQEFATLAGIELDAENHRGTWTIREHSQLKRQWRAVRRMPVIVQIIIGLFALTWFTIVFFVTWLVVGGLTMR